VLKATDEYFHEQDSIERWIEERCTELPNVSVKKGVAYADFKRWAEGGGIYVLSKRQFLDRLLSRPGIREDRIGKDRDRVLTGLGLCVL